MEGHAVTGREIHHEIDEAVQAEWQEALPYLRSRGGVVFLSYCRFWEPHAFVQQSLVRYLIGQQIPVKWWDGVGWRPYQPTLYFDSPWLEVKQLQAFPGNRFGRVRDFNTHWAAEQIKGDIQRFGKPLIWVQGGIDEALAEVLPYIDVFSTFDDPYRHSPQGTLCQKAKLVVCQNSYALELFRVLGEKAILLYPPFDVRPQFFDETINFFLPQDFPTQRMGYVGSFFAKDFNFDLLEYMILTLPDWGFLLTGRTDAEGESRVSALRAKHRNFFRLPWVPRQEVANAWKLLETTLLLYRQERTQDGAFPTKILESLYFGIPCVATDIPKTRDLKDFCPRTNSPAELCEKAVCSSRVASPPWTEPYRKLATAMHPKHHLSVVAQRISRK